MTSPSPAPMAAKGRHTPGPWIWADGYRGLFGAGPDNAVLNYASYEGMWLASDFGERMKADAALIAAAPDLLAALKSILYYIEEDGYGFEHTCERVARAAIAKAGGQP